MGKLTKASVKATQRPGRYGDGNGLSLLVGRSGSKSWILRVHDKGTRRDIGLGSVTTVSLKQARERAAEIRWQVKVGMGLIAKQCETASNPSFRETAMLFCAERFNIGKTGNKGKLIRHWLEPMEAYAFPAIGDVPAGEVDEAAVRELLSAIWLAKPDKAKRLREQIPILIDWAARKGYRQGSLTMSMVDRALPAHPTKPRRHRAMEYTDVPAFMADLRKKETIGRLALEALILTVGRICDVRAMQWSEIDMGERLWRVRTRVGRGSDERVRFVPLSDAMIELLERARRYKRGDTDLVFRGVMRGKQLSVTTLGKVALDMGYPITAEGFRTAFAEWAREKTPFPRELREAVLAHADPRAVAGDDACAVRLEERRKLMEAWAGYCEGTESGEATRVKAAQ